MSTVASVFIVYICQQYWTEYHSQSVLKSRHQLRETKIYQNLINGPSFPALKGAVVQRKALQDKLGSLINPNSVGSFYPLVIGQHGVGKTTLIKMAINTLPSPKGIIYIDIPLMDDVSFIKALQKAIGWTEDPVLDASKRKSSSFIVIVFMANILVAVSLSDVWKSFYNVASKFKEEFGVVPVVVMDNANRIAARQLELLESLQDRAKSAADDSIVRFVFVSSEGTVLRRMMGTLNCV